MDFFKSILFVQGLKVGFFFFFPRSRVGTCKNPAGSEVRHPLDLPEVLKKSSNILQIAVNTVQEACLVVRALACNSGNMG